MKPTGFYVQPGRKNLSRKKSGSKKKSTGKTISSTNKRNAIIVKDVNS